MPGALVAMTNFSALSSHAIIAATVSALMLSNVPLIVGRQRAHDRHEVVVELLDDDARVDAVDVADEAIVDGLAAPPARAGAWSP